MGGCYDRMLFGEKVCVPRQCASTKSCGQSSEAMQAPPTGAPSSLGDAGGDDHSTVSFGSTQVTDGPGVVYLPARCVSTDATSKTNQR
ncbi:hypothetical protein BJV78DRAFT_132283 [Lactifluus subvellereus]|nr:hypothetical protein BJV78DRAFT_132283 [Lactifluus subvellereus]